MQVQPMKPVLKPPGSALLKLRYDGPLSNFAFKFNSRRYDEAVAGGVAAWQAGAHTRPQLSLT